VASTDGRSNSFCSTTRAISRGARECAGDCDSRAAAVLGHFLSSTSLAAAPAYKDARIPALTGSAAATI